MENLTLSHINKNPYYRVLYYLIGLALLGILLILLILILGHFITIPCPDILLLKKQFISSVHIDALNPQPEERLIFNIVVLLSPFITFFSLLLAKKIAALLIVLFDYKIIRFLSKIFLLILILFVSFFIIFLILYLAYAANLVNHSLLYSDLAWGIILLISACIALAQSGKLPHKFFINRKLAVAIKTVIIFLLVGSCVFQVFSFRVGSFSFFTYISPWKTNIIDDFNAVFYPLVQVVYGKTLLVQLPTQYGFYPEILNLIFKIIPLTVFNFTFLMGILQTIAMFSLLFVLLKLTKNYILTALYILSLCFMTASVFVLVKWGDLLPYYQYWPIRFFFPAVSVLFIFWFVRRETYLKTAMMALLSVVSIIWNQDTGIVIALSFLIYLCSQFTFLGVQERRFIYFYRSIFFISLVLLGVVAFGLYLILKAGSLPDWNLIFHYPNVFYLNGFMHISLPVTLDFWMIFAAIYLMGIFISFDAWLLKKHSVEISLIFYLSILGIGLFTYYQYRAHVWNLIGVSWPGLLLCFILLNRMFCLIKCHKLPSVFLILGVPWLAFGCLVSITFIHSIPELYRIGKIIWTDISSPPQKNSKLWNDLQFIRKNIHASQEIVILGKYQSILYAKLRCASPLKGPGVVETIIEKDRQKQIEQLLLFPVSYLFIDETEKGSFPNDFKILLSKYYIKSISRYGMVYLCPRFRGRPHLNGGS